MDKVGKTISHYRIIEKLGQGGMATVYRAYDTHLERDVAIKVVRKEVIAPKDLNRILRRFEREAKSMAKFMHPNIVRVSDFGDHEGAPYLVMAYLPGGTLRQYLRARNSQPLPPQQAVEMIMPIADALRYAHQQGIIHRDVKPSNILITEDGVMMLADFGVAKLLEEDIKITQTNMLVGTPVYMAPEQWQHQVFPASDQYALGVVLFEMLTSRKPFAAGTPAAMAIKQATEQLPRPNEFGIQVPEALERILFKALANQPQDRYAEIGEFWQALKALEWPSMKNQPKRNHQRVKPVSTNSENSVEEECETRVLLTFDDQKADRITPTTLPGHTSTRQPQNELSKRSTWLSWALGMAGGVLLLGLLVWGKVKLFNRGRDQEADETTAIAAVQQSTTSIADVQATATTPKTKIIIPSKIATPTLGIVSTNIRAKDGMEIVYVPEGNFTMGSYRDSDQQPVHEVYLDAFWIDKYEVTNIQYTTCVVDGVCTTPDTEKYRYFSQASYYDNPEYGNYPVIYVDWFQASAYCEWAGGSLPTEAQWEKAARGTDGRTYPWGEADPTCDLANYSDCVGNLSEVGSFPNGASPFGALDMAGNVGEWVADWYDDEYYAYSPAENPTGPTSGTLRVFHRGGAWMHYAGVIYSSNRNGNIPSIFGDNMGFRCVSEP